MCFDCTVYPSPSKQRYKTVRDFLQERPVVVKQKIFRFLLWGVSRGYFIDKSEDISHNFMSVQFV